MNPLVTSDRLLVRLPNWLGDLVASEPLVRALHQRYAAEGRPQNLSLAGHTALLELFEGRFEGARRLPLEEAPPARAQCGHDVALLLDGSARSAVTAARAGVRHRLGWASGARAPWLTLAVRPARESGRTPLRLGRRGRFPRRLPRPFTSSATELAAVLGVIVHDPRPRLVPLPRALARVDERLVAAGFAADEPLLVLSAGARRGSAKSYGAERWGAVLRALAERTAPRVAVVGGPGEEAEVRRAVEAAPGARALAVVDPVAGLGELVGWCARARLFVGVDGGPRHVAAAVGTPRVVLLGPTDARHSALPGERRLHVTLACRPCHLEACPLEGDAHHACMARIAPASVADAVDALLGEMPREAPLP